MQSLTDRQWGGGGGGCKKKWATLEEGRKGSSRLSHKSGEMIVLGRGRR